MEVIIVKSLELTSMLRTIVVRNLVKPTPVQQVIPSPSSAMVYNSVIISGRWWVGGVAELEPVLS